LEAVAADREANVVVFRKTLEPLRTILAAQPYFGGGASAYADYVVFGFFQWARCISSFPLLLRDDPVWVWREQLLAAFDDSRANPLVMACNAGLILKSRWRRFRLRSKMLLKLVSCTKVLSLRRRGKEDRCLEFIAASFARPGVPHVAFIEIFGPGGGELTFATLWAADIAVRLKVRLRRYPSVHRHDVANSCL
jgi:hypothetical protein